MWARFEHVYWMGPVVGTSGRERAKVDGKVREQDLVQGRNVPFAIILGPMSETFLSKQPNHSQRDE